VIVAIAGRPIWSAGDVVRAVTEELRPGQIVTVTILRNGKRKAVRVTLSDRPNDPASGR
jgi:S1-C subfamily serine protease